MRILVDADSMPVRIREIVVRHAERRAIQACFYAKRPIPLPTSPARTAHVVEDADEAIVTECEPGDLVVTRDIPLAARVVAMGLTVLNDRGDIYTLENIRERLSLRNAAQAIRDAGLEEPRGRTFGHREVGRFANALDRELARRVREADSR
jgi:uncharacterized protein YaiI (UPF0178 family)